MMKRSSSETISRGEKLLLGMMANSDFGGELFKGHVVVGVDADVGGDRHGLAGDGLRVEIAVDECARGGERVVAAGADAGDTAFGLEHVTGAGEHQARR